MEIDYKKFLPASLRTNRWGEFIEAFQSLMEEEILPYNLDVIRTSKIIDEMSDEQIIDFCAYLGRTVISDTGYTITTDHLRKQLRTTTLRILNKTVRKGYWYNLYCYNLKGDIYPIYKDGSDLYVAEDWYLSNESDIAVQYLDTGLFLDTDEFATLDRESIVDSLTRHMVLSYYPLFIEYGDNTIFANDITLLAFYSDIMLSKRKTELIYFEPQIIVNLNSDKTVTTVFYTDYEGNSSTSIKSILIEDNLSDIDKIRFGSGGHSTVDSSITDVETFEVELDYSTEITPQVESLTKFRARKKLTQKPKFTNSGGDLFNITEIAFLNSSSDCIFYAKFPAYRLLDLMYSNIAVNISII